MSDREITVDSVVSMINGRVSVAMRDKQTLLRVYRALVALGVSVEFTRYQSGLLARTDRATVQDLLRGL